MITYMIGDDQPERQQRVQQFRSQSSRASHQQQNPTNKYSNSPPIRNQMHSEAQVHRIEQNAKNRNEGYRAESPAFGRDSESEYQQHYPTQDISNLRDIAVNRDKAHDAQLDKRSPTAFAGGVAGVDRNHLSVSRSIAGNSGLERNSHSLEAIRGQHPIFRDNVRPDEVRASRDNLRNTGGIGLLLSAFPDKGMVLIDEVVPGAPAAFDGRIQPRDRLLSVDGADVTCRDAATITRLIAGSEGSIVTLDLAECRSGARYKVELVRQRVNPPPFPQTTPRPGPPPTSAAAAAAAKDVTVTMQHRAAAQSAASGRPASGRNSGERGELRALGLGLGLSPSQRAAPAGHPQRPPAGQPAQRPAPIADPRPRTISSPRQPPGARPVSVPAAAASNPRSPLVAAAAGQATAGVGLAFTVGSQAGSPPTITAVVPGGPADALGVRLMDLPITPEKVLRAIKAQGGAKPQARR